ncbi:hypothetical protein KAJ27_14025 [bacterium]|nr:hypothetical protein [bacterium]
MKYSIILLVSFIFIITLGCGSSNTTDKSTVAKKEKSVASITLNNHEDVKKLLSELKIEIFPESKFIEVKKIKVISSMKNPPQRFNAIYSISDKNPKKNETEFTTFYKKLYNEKLKPAGWENKRLPGSSIFNLYPKSGNVKHVSISITPSDYVTKEKPQVITISISIK